jgi:outer membrane protein assembly factor BamB
MKRILPLLILLPLAVAADVRGGDWSHWRGPEQTGVSREVGLPDKWNPATGENVIWKAPIGGRSTPIIQKGRVYFITGHDCGSGPTQQEQVVCLDEKDGKILWQYKFNVFHTGIVADRLGWTAMCGDPETDRVYAHTTGGLLLCLDNAGKLVWSHSLTEEFGRISGYGGRLTSPIVDGDLVIIGLLNASWGDQAIGRNRLVAFDKKTGQIVWWASGGLPPKDTNSSVPVIAVINNERLVITGGGDGAVHAFKVRTGEKVWSYVFSDGGINPSPVVKDGFVYIAHGENNPDGGTQGRVICLDANKVEGGKPKLVWQEDGLKIKFASPLLVDDRLYVCDDLANMFCMDAKTGKQYWRRGFSFGRNDKGSPTWADGKIYIGEIDSHFLIIDPVGNGPNKPKILNEVVFPAVGGVAAEVNGSAAIVNGHIYVQTSYETYCIGLKDAKGSNRVPPGVPEVPKGGKPTHIQVFPADVTLSPGDSVELKAFAYDETGHRIGPAKVDWSLAGARLPEGVKPMPNQDGPPPLAGTLSEKQGDASKLTVAPERPGQFGRVVVKLGDLEAEVRVRVAPKLPYKPDFSKVPEGRTPGGWVNTQGKFEVKKLQDGLFVLSKTTANASPLVARANAYIGTPNLSNYTIEAEIMAEAGLDGLPDIGVVAARYKLRLCGNRQEVTLGTWEDLPRIDDSLALPWKEKVWYKFKLVHEVKDGKVTVRGKVWEAAKPEPNDWTLVVNDPVPNLEGAPALYSYAVGTRPNQLAKSYFRNVSITPNK